MICFKAINVLKVTKINEYIKLNSQLTIERRLF